MSFLLNEEGGGRGVFQVPRPSCVCPDVRAWSCCARDRTESDRAGLFPPAAPWVTSFRDLNYEPVFAS